MRRLTLIVELEIDERDPHVASFAMPTNLAPEKSPLHNELGEGVRKDVKKVLGDIGYVARLEVVYLPRMLRP